MEDKIVNDIFDKAKTTTEWIDFMVFRSYTMAQQGLPTPIDWARKRMDVLIKRIKTNKIK